MSWLILADYILWNYGVEKNDNITANLNAKLFISASVYIIFIDIFSWFQMSAMNYLNHTIFP